MRTVLTMVMLVLASAALAEPPVRDDEPGWWDALLYVDSMYAQNPTHMNFSYWIPPEGDPRPAYIRNGSEFLEADARWDGERLVMDFPHYDSRLEAKRIMNVGGRLAIQGKWTKQRSDEVAEMDVWAIEAGDYFWQHTEAGDEGWEIKPQPARTERWVMEFSKSGTAFGVFKYTGRSEQYEDPSKPDRQELHGTIMTPTGDYRFLSGEFGTSSDGDTYKLSVFDGAHAFVFEAEKNRRDRTLRGDFYSGTHWHETFTARRLGYDEEFSFPDPFSEVTLQPGQTRLGLPRLNEAPYAGKPTIVQIFGTWCPNCHDEAPVLVDLYERYHGKGLQILSLAYEYTDDRERSERQIAHFKERHGATWEFVAAGINDKQKTAASLPALSAVKSYPTTIWINPDGTVRAIHSGFSGPATGEEHEKTKAEFETLTKEIVEAQ